MGVENKSSTQPDWDDDEEDEYTIPPRQEIVTPEGLKKVIDYSVNPEGYLMKTTRTFKVEKITHKVQKGVALRRKWARFGDCKNKPPGLERGISDISPEEINLEYVAQKEDEEPQPEDDAAQAKIDVQKRLAAEKFQKRLQERKAGGVTWAQEMSLKAAMATGDVPSDGSVKPASAGKWVPPSMRNRIAANGGEMPLPSAHTRDDSATVRVSNVSANTTENDLQDLFRSFGTIKRIYLSRDRVTGESKGFAYVAFHSIADAQDCIDKLDGYGYDHLILRVEWAKPSEQRARDPNAVPVPGYTRA